jgi:hypothetical protein
MTDRLTIGFADSRAALQGVAIAGVGTLLRLGEQLTATPPPQIAAPEGDGTAWRIGSPDSYELVMEPLGQAAGLAGGGQISLCRVTGTIAAQQLEGLGTLTRRPASGGLALERCVTVWFDAQLGFALAARRPTGASGHGEEQLEAVAFRGEPLEATRIELPRLSTTYDPSGVATHAGIELWETAEAEFAVRIGGEALAHGELAHPDGTRTRVAFVEWHHDGRRGSGSYEITNGA